MKDLRRSFPCNDAYLLEVSSALQVLFVENIAVFTAFDSSLDLNYANQWLCKIKEAYAFRSDKQLKDIQAQKTDEVNDVMRLCRQKYLEVKFFAFKSFEKKDKKREEFGIKDYAKVNRNVSEFFVFMEVLYLAALKHQTELITSGMKFSDIEEINDLAQALLVASSTRNSYKKAKKNITFQRIQCLNECYASCRTVIDAAMLIYHNDYARKKTFIFWNGKHKRYAA